MKKLPPNFSIEKYGIFVRLVNESDAPFILRLRTNTKLARYIHSTDNDIQKQIEWIRSYKERERDGKDYYFIYFQSGIPIGLNRIYNIEEYSATGGSWLCEPGLDVEKVISTLFIMRNILFETLGKLKDKFDVRKDNVQVLRTHQMMGAKLVGESMLDLYLELDKRVYLKKRDYLLDLLNIK